ncbi:MAG: glycosyltransferase family 2 protein [Nitrospinae bacterium]|nr:glycosyltransferase family 2 protein [Nitrospinota bacterium]
MRLSIVSTLYNSAPHLLEFYQRITQCAQEITHDYELILVNDGSPDNSLELAVSLHEKDQRVKIIDLSRNFGHHRAMMTGLSYALSDYVFLIDSDLEEPPETLKVFWEEIQGAKDFDVVFGVQGKRRGGWLERVSGTLYYKLVNWLSDVKVPENFLTVRLMTQNYTRNLVQYKERELNFSVLTELVGFKKKKIVVEKSITGPSNYSTFKKFSVLVNAITSSTNRPLWLIFYLGLAITLCSSIFVIKLLIDRGLYGVGLVGWTSVIVSIFFFGGLIIFVLGIIGIYLSKVFVESKQRPYVVIRNIYGSNRER